MIAPVLAVALAAAAPVRPIEAPVTGPGRPRVLLAPRSGPTATLVVSFDAGAVADGDQLGLTRVAQYALLHANRRLDAEALQLGAFASAGSLSVETGQREARFVLTADRRDFGALAARLLQGLLAPSLVPGRFDDARARARRDARGSDGTDARFLVTSMAADDGHYRNEPHGEDAAIERFDDAQIREHVARWFPASAATVVVAGSFDRDPLVRLLRLAGGGGRAPAQERPTLSLPVSSRHLAPRETHLLAYPLPIGGAGDAAAAQVLAHLLDAQLWTAFREAGVSYSFAVEAQLAPWLDLLVVVLPAHAAAGTNLEPVLRDVVDRVRTGRVDAEAFERARAAAEAAAARQDEDPEALARALATDGGRWPAGAVAAELGSLERPAFLARAAAWLDPPRRFYAYFGPTP